MNPTLRNLRPFASLLVLALLVGACSGGNGDTTTSTRAPILDTTTTSRPTTSTTRLDAPEVVDPSEDVEAGREKALLVVDGWSAKILDFTVDTIGSNKRPKLVPLSPELTKQILASHPKVVANAGARMINPDAGWACDAEGCATSAGKVENLEGMLADASTIPVFGPMYEKWGIASVLYGAEVGIPVEAEGVNVAKGDRFVSIPAWSTHPGIVVQRAEGAVPVLEAWAGLGAIFNPQPLWAAEQPLAYVPRSAADAVDPDGVAAADETFMGTVRSGLASGDTDATFLSLSASELSFMTSPSTGCGAYVNCVPASQEVRVDQLGSETHEVCVPSEDTGELLAAVMVIDDEIRHLNHELPVTQNGLFGGVDPADFERADLEGTRLFGLMPPVSGSHQLRVVTARVYYGDPSDSVAARLGLTYGYNAVEGDEVFSGGYGFDQVMAALDGLVVPCGS